MNITAKKSILIVCLVFTMSLLCCGLALAAPSIQVTDAELADETVTATVGGEEVVFSLSETEPNTYVSADGTKKIVLTNVSDPEMQQQALEEATDDPELQNSTLALVFDLSYFVNGAQANFDGSITITFSIPGLQPGDIVIALHGSDENGFKDAAKVVGTNNGDGTASFTLTGFSPFAVFVTAADNEEGASPKTGSDNTLPLCALLAAAGLAAVIYSKKQLSK